MKIRDNIYETFCKAKEPNLKKQLHEKYKLYRNQIVCLTRACKETYYQSSFENNKTNSKKIWSGIRTILNLKNTKANNNYSILIDKALTTNKKDIANHFNTFFTSIAQKLVKKIPPTHNSFKSSLKNQKERSFFIGPVDIKETENIISSLQENKASGPNSFPIKMLKTSKKQLSVPLTYLINLAFETGVFPDILKTAKLIPIIKKGDQQDCNNYRPISLLSNIGKIIEKLIHKGLFKFLNSNNCLFNYQLGFRNHHSTNHALISITEKIRKAIDDGKIACGVFLDFQKAFDTVDHDILLAKLEHYGIRGIPLKLFKTYLTERTQHNKDISETLPINIGVPQGSVLGPLLFLIYINDFHNIVTYSDIHHFADDTNLLYASKSIKDINRRVNFDLKNIIHWLRANKISLNADNTELILFRSKHKVITKNLNF